MFGFHGLRVPDEVKILIYLLCLFTFSDLCSVAKIIKTINRHLIHLCLYKPGFLISEVAGDGGSVVAVADGNDLAVDLNEHCVSKGFAAPKWCAYEPAVTERRV
jgi:hypothetical protein